MQLDYKVRGGVQDSNMLAAMWALSSWVWQRKNSEPRTLAQEELYLVSKTKVYLKRRFRQAAQSCLHLLESKCTEAEGTSHLGCLGSGNKLQKQKKGPWRQVQGISLGQAATAHCPPDCKSPGNL